MKSRAKRKYTADWILTKPEIMEESTQQKRKVTDDELVAPDAIFDLQEDSFSAPESPIKIRIRDLDLMDIRHKRNGTFER